MSLFGGAGAGAGGGADEGEEPRIVCRTFVGKNGAPFAAMGFESSGPPDPSGPGKTSAPKAEDPKASRECAGCGGMRMEDAEEEAIKTEELRIEESAAEMGRKGFAGTYSHSALNSAKRRGRTCICPFKTYTCSKCAGKLLDPSAEWALLREEEEIKSTEKKLLAFGCEVEADESILVGFTVRVKHPTLSRVQGKCRTCVCPIERPRPPPGAREGGLFGGSW